MKFKCMLTNNVVEFTQEVDITTMLEHPQYTVVEEKPKEIKEEKKPLKIKE